MTDLVDRLRATDGTYDITTILDRCNEAAAEIERLRAENFALAANQCKAGYSGEHGEHMCAEIDRLRAALREFLECAMVDAMMEGPALKGWSRPALDRCWHNQRAALGEPKP